MNVEPTHVSKDIVQIPQGVIPVPATRGLLGTTAKRVTQSCKVHLSIVWLCCFY